MKKDWRVQGIRIISPPISCVPLIILYSAKTHVSKCKIIIFIPCISELPPDFKGDMKDVTVATEQNATFQVELTKGDARARWFKDGELRTLNQIAIICVYATLYFSNSPDFLINWYFFHWTWIVLFLILDKEIDYSEHVMLKIEGKRQKLIIYNASFQDMGTYTCVVGTKKKTAKLKVERKCERIVN